METFFKLPISSHFPLFPKERVRFVVREIMNNTGFNPDVENVDRLFSYKTAATNFNANMDAEINPSAAKYATLEPASTAAMPRKIAASLIDRLRPTVPAAFSNDRAVVQSVTKTIRALCWVSREEWFEVGKDSNLSVGLQGLFLRYPNITLNVLPGILRGPPPVSEGAVCETLRTIGNIAQDATASRRLFLLVDYLNHKSHTVRDCAALAISYLDDTRAAPFLALAKERETVPSLRDDMQAILDQLGL